VKKLKNVKNFASFVWPRCFLVASSKFMGKPTNQLAQFSSIYTRLILALFSSSDVSLWLHFCFTFSFLLSSLAQFSQLRKSKIQNFLQIAPLARPFSRKGEPLSQKAQRAFSQARNIAH